MDYPSVHRDIIEACKKGNRQSQFELYRLYSKAMYNICLRMVKNDLDAEDLLQNSFTDIFMKLDSFGYQSSIGAWIKRIVINNCINFLKKKRLYFAELNERLSAEEVAEPAPVKEVALDVKKVNKALLQLPDGYRVVFTLYLMEGYDHKEIAEILSISEATSKSQYSRAKAKLRNILQGELSRS